MKEGEGKQLMEDDGRENNDRLEDKNEKKMYKKKSRRRRRGGKVINNGDNTEGLKLMEERERKKDKRGDSGRERIEGSGD